jgi:hypothetical protein
LEFLKICIEKFIRTFLILDVMMNDKDIDNILKRYSKKQNYPNFECDADEIIAYFGSLEGALDGTVDEIESEIISKISGLNVSPQFDCGLSLSIAFSPMDTFDGDVHQYERLLDNACTLTKEILRTHGVSEEYLKREYDQESSRCNNPN